MQEQPEFIALIDAVAVLLIEEHDCGEFYCGFGMCAEKLQQFNNLESAYNRARDSVLYANPGLDTPVPDEDAS